MRSLFRELVVATADREFLGRR